MAIEYARAGNTKKSLGDGDTAIGTGSAVVGDVNGTGTPRSGVTDGETSSHPKHKIDIPDALSRADVVGRHLLKKAKEWGWKDDGEGAFEYIQRISYEQGLEDGKGKRLAYQAQYQRDLRAATKLGISVKEFRAAKVKGISE